MVARPWFVVLALFMLVSSGCADRPPTQPEDTSPLFAKGGGTVSVTAADPSFGEQGASGLVVRVLGSGFDAGSRASWERDGAADPKVKVNSTTFVSASELRANIDIAVDAAIDLYDVAVYTTGGRKGIGTERFEVTTAELVGTMESVHAITDAGLMVGRNAELNAAFFDPAGGITHDLGVRGVAFDIDQAGQLIAGQGGNLEPVVWTRSGATWQLMPLPALGGRGFGRAVGSDAIGAAWVIAGYASEQVSRRESRTRPVKWTRSADGWVLEVLPQGSYGRGMAMGVSSLGVVVGHVGDPYRPAVWDPDGALTVLAPLPNSSAADEAWEINSAGTIVVGTSAKRPVFWTRNPDGTWNSVPVDLDAPFGVSCGTQDKALDVNSGGIVVGTSCGGAYAWIISGRSVLARIPLGALGVKAQEPTLANSINDASPARPAGRAFTNRGQVVSVGVTWAGISAPQ
jgi:hypothetical protein